MWGIALLSSELRPPPPYVAVYLQCVAVCCSVLQCVAVLTVRGFDMEGHRIVELRIQTPPPRHCLCKSHFELFDKEGNRILELCIRGIPRNDQRFPRLGSSACCKVCMCMCVCVCVLCVYVNQFDIAQALSR